MSERADQIELDQATAGFQTAEDPRPKIDEPPPVRLLSVDDCYLWSPAGLEPQLDQFYAGLLRFQREETPPDEGSHELVYRAENFRLRIEILERPLNRDDFRPLGVIVPSLADLGQRLADAKIEYEHQRGLLAGQENFLLNDPAGNPVIVGEFRVMI
jgi:hypothetical protein